MSDLSPRAIATLGVGFGPTLVAYLGLWPVTTTGPILPPPAFGPGPVIEAISKSRGLIDDRELLEIIPIIVEVINGRR